MELRAGDQWIITSRLQAITDQPERALAAVNLAVPTMTLARGTRLGPYQIESPIGDTHVTLLGGDTLYPVLLHRHVQIGNLVRNQLIQLLLQPIQLLGI